MKGQVVYLYAFDVANEIATSTIHDILATRPFPFDIRSEAPFPRESTFYRPMSIELPAIPERLNGHAVIPQIRVYNIGVISIALRTGVEIQDLAGFRPFRAPHLDDGRSLESIAQAICSDVCDNLREAIERFTPPTDPEVYTVFCLTETEDGSPTEEWVVKNRDDIAALLTNVDPNKLSEMQRSETLRIQRSFSLADTTVIDWDAALVIDLNGCLEDKLFILELANIQLEEYRVIDRRLDAHLNQAYDDLKRRPLGILGWGSSALRALRMFQVDVTKLNDEVTHITKLVGDWFLARLYVGARERFYLEQWRQSVENRIGQLDRLYSVAHAEVANRRMIILECLIVLFCAIDVLALWLARR